MRVKFTEGAAAVTVEGVGRVERGEIVDVPDEQGEQLLEQGWVAVAAKQKAPAKNKQKAPASTKSSTPAEPTTTPENGQEEGKD